MNKLLLRQLERYNIQIEDLPDNFKSFLVAVDNSYKHGEKERQLLEHTMDISSQELTEANRTLRTRKKELENYNAELRSFSYIASHDLKEPLRSIGSFMRLVERREPLLSKESKEFIQFAVEGAERMKALLDDLMKYSLIDASEKQRFNTLDLNEVIEEVSLNLNAKIEDSKAIIQYHNLPYVKGKKAQLVLLFQNLLDNAMKFRKDKPPIITINHSELPKDEFIQISVMDNGIGIDEDFRKKVFELFKRLHHKDAYKGTGIGLAMCKKIVERHSGQIWIDDSYQKGLKINFTLKIPDQREIDQLLKNEGEPTERLALES